MALAGSELVDGATVRPRADVVEPADPAEVAAPMVFNPAELRQLRQCYQELLDLHRAEVVLDENLDDAHRLFVEQVLPLHAILREQDRMIVDPRVDLTY